MKTTNKTKAVVLRWRMIVEVGRKISEGDDSKILVELTFEVHEFAHPLTFSISGWQERAVFLSELSVEIFDYVVTFNMDGAVMNQCRYLASRIDTEIPVRTLFAAHQIDGVWSEVDAQFAQKNTHFLRAG